LDGGLFLFKNTRKKEKKMEKFINEILQFLEQLAHTIIITLLGIGFLTWLAMAFFGSV